MGKLVVMDYSDVSVNVYNTNNIDENSTNEVEEYIHSKGHRVCDCYYMLGNDIKINRFDLSNN